VQTLPRLSVALLFCSTAFAGNAARIELGRRLFMDPTVSRGARFSCASCHAPDHGFGDPRVLSEDENGATARHSQTLLDLKDGVGMHWDGEFFRVRELLVARLGSTSEARTQAQELASRHFAATRGEGNREDFERRLRDTAPPYYEGADASITWAAPLARRLDEDGRYHAAFRRAFGSGEITTERLVSAMEAYVLSLRSGLSAYDRGDLSPAAQRGLALFRGRANCASCHKGDRFTDDSFHNTGIAFVPGNPADSGRAGRSFLAAEFASFKTPSLRDVARRAPYMHDGTFPTLREVVLYYDKGCTRNGNLDPRIRRLDLEASEVDDLVAFLESLTSDERPGLGRAVTHSADTRVRIEDLEGKPIGGLPVRVRPFGDRLGGGGAAEATACTTDQEGWIAFRFPDWTHVTLEAEGLSIGEGHPLPDCVREAKLIAAPKDATAVRVKGPALPGTLVATGRRLGEVSFRRVRSLGAREALYVAERAMDGSDVLQFGQLPKGAVSRRYALEFGRGFSEAIDLRPDPEGPRAPTLGVGGMPPPAAENGGRQTENVARAAARR